MTAVSTNVVGQATASGRSLLEEVSAFLYDEAELADASDYDGWLELWDDPCTYWVPCNLDDYDPNKHVSIIYDGRARLEERCFRLVTGGAHSQEPRSKLCRVIGNIRAEESPTDPALVHASSRMMLVELRLGRKNVYAAKCAFILRRVDGQFRIQQKKVMLLDSDEPLGNLTFLV